MIDIIKIILGVIAAGLAEQLRRNTQITEGVVGWRAKERKDTSA